MVYASFFCFKVESFGYTGCQRSQLSVPLVLAFVSKSY